MEEIQEKGGYFDIQKSGDIHLKNIMDAVLNRDEGVIIVENKIDNEYVAVTKIEEPGWYFLTIFPRTIFIEHAMGTARFILLLGLFSLMIEILILYFVLRRQIARPLHTFTGATDQIAKGDFNLNLDTARNDELGRLAKSFSAMSQAVAERDQKLEARRNKLEIAVKDRTKDLEESNQQLEKQREQLRL